MNDRFKYLIKNTGILTISNFSSKLLVFVLVPLYTSVLSTTEYGIYDLIVSTVTLMYPVLTVNIVDAVMRFSMDQSCDKKKVASIGFRYVTFSICVFTLFLAIFSYLNIWPEIDGLEIYIGLYYLFYVLSQYFIQFAKGLERVADMGIAGVLSTLVMIVGNILFLLVFKWGLEGFLFASILSQAIQTIYLSIRIKFWSYIESGIDRQLCKEMLLYCVPLIATTLGWWVNTTSDKYIVSFMCGIAANGILSVSYKIPQILNTLQGIFIQAWQISAIKEYGEENTAHFYGNTFNIINMLMCAACAWLIILSKPLASVLYAKDFYVAWMYVPFLLISSVLNCASGLLGPILSAQKESKAMAKAAIIGALVNIVLNIALVYGIGVQGATIATVISSFIIYQVRKNAVGKNIYIEDYPIVLVTWVLLCVQAFIEIYTSYWYVEVILMLVMLWINKKQFLFVIRSLGNVIKRK